MKSFLVHTLLIFIIYCATNTSAQGQYLILNLLNEEFDEFEVSGIRSVKFISDSLVLFQNNGDVNSWAIADIANYKFGASTLSLMDAALDESQELKIYPNPSSDLVHVEYTGRQGGDILIEIIDSNGKLVELLYRGSHTEMTVVSWDVRSGGVSAQTYFCRVSGKSNTVTAKIIVQ